MFWFERLTFFQYFLIVPFLYSHFPLFSLFFIAFRWASVPSSYLVEILRAKGVPQFSRLEVYKGGFIIYVKGGYGDFFLGRRRGAMSFSG